MKDHSPRPRRALTVSQDTRARVQYAKELLQRGCDVHTASRGLDALELLRKSRYEIIVVDESLDMGLVEFVLNLRDLVDHQPVIMVGGAEMEHFERVWRRCDVFYAGEQERLAEHLKAAVQEAEERPHALVT